MSFEVFKYRLEIDKAETVGMVIICQLEKVVQAIDTFHCFKYGNRGVFNCHQRINNAVIFM